ncbi:hypothetical protein [Caulobacter sp. NIBR1757]|uniref:hypothetical protein n=1 Tax=Caulobacter sp. NIBR1757 TaxID=3016000 RepID=UPI0022F05151|nr:hypothetical protein [Caulobacter sp. NIBR1757]WGM40365.1 hypothetical protein AMEJIAPC_03310 [Caulobacter sp. NIBR1757]
MSVTRTGGFRRSYDHFEPEVDDDPHAQRRTRGLLEQIDYAAFAANKELIGQALGQGDIRKFQRLAIAAAQARAVWVAQALAASASGGKLSSADLAQLTHLRATFEELTEAYEAMRRMVERGYLAMPAAPAG